MTESAARVSDEDLSFLDRAVQLGRRGWGRVSPNPMVGCVLVLRGEVVGEGWHRELGGPHAEAHALAGAGGRARGATAYTSLEPCAHTGRTPPCARALLDAGVARVVFGASDPGAGAGGAAVLRAAGVRVDGPAFSRARAASHNPAFFHVARAGTPYLALKLALSLDGRISRAGEQTRLTGRPARAHAHHLRAGFDAIMVGANTMEIDDPRLTARGPTKPRRAPDRIVLDSRARIGPGARVLREGAGGRVRVFTGPDAPDARVRALRRRGATVHAVPLSKSRDSARPSSVSTSASSAGDPEESPAGVRTQPHAGREDHRRDPRGRGPDPRAGLGGPSGASSSPSWPRHPEWSTAGGRARSRDRGRGPEPAPKSPADGSARSSGASARGLDLRAVLAVCHREGLASILCEGGGVLASSLLRSGLLQRLHLYFAPRTLGPGSVPAFPGRLGDSLWDGWRPAEPPAALGRDILWVLDRDG